MRITRSRLWSTVLTYKLGLGSVVVFMGLIVLSAVGPIFSQSPYKIDPIHQLQPPSLNHFFGTDDLGRDLFSRVIFAGRVSLALGLGVTVVAGILGVALGLIAGTVRWVDSLIMRSMDGMLAFPALLLAIAIIAVTGPGVLGEATALVLVFIPRFARLQRSSVLNLQSAEFIEAARISGCSRLRVLVNHVLPNSLGPLVVLSSFIYAETILWDSALSFLGLGVAPPTPTWGNIIGEAKSYIFTDPWFSVFPGIFIVMAVVSLNLLGDTLRRVLDPEVATQGGLSRGKSYRGRRRSGLVSVGQESEAQWEAHAEGASDGVISAVDPG